MEKTVLILHGWPGGILEQYFLTKHFKQKGYSVLTPEIFSKDYIFNAENITKDVKSHLKDENLDVIVGISLGGLILPYIARKFSNSKLIFIASGPYLKAKVPFFNFLIRILRGKWILKFVGLVRHLPNNVLAFFYRIASPFSGKEDAKRLYEEDMHKNLDVIKGIPVEEESEILEFVYGLDNTDILRSLKNKALIFNGKDDLFMPEERGRKLHELLNNSELIINNGEHFDVFTEADLPLVDKFLG